MRKAQWTVLGLMALASAGWTWWTGNFVMLNDRDPLDLFYPYLCMLWVIITIAFFVCRWLEKE